MRIRTQLVLVLSGLVAGSFSAAWILASLIGTAIITNLLTEQYLVYSRLLGKMAQAAVALRAEPLFGQYMRFLQDAVPGVRYVYLENPDGMIVAHTDPAYVHKPAREWKASHAAAMALDYTSPVEIDGRAASTLRLGVVADLRPLVLDHVRTKALSPFIVLGLGVMSVSVLLGVGFAFLLARPIRILASAAREVGRGRLDVEVPVTSSGELGDLAGHFNEMVRRLRSLDELKDEFIATVSHDLRNPMAAITMFADYTLTEDPDNDKLLPKHRKQLSIIRDNAMRLNMFVTNILDSAKMKAGRMEYHLQTVALEPIARSVAALYSLVAAQKGVALLLEIPPDLPAFSADPERLEQVLSNLISNSMKFTGQGGRIALGGRDDGSHVEIAVTDTGKGILKEELPRLFERFRQADVAQQKSRRSQGTGLGLYIVKQTVEAMGGSVVLESELGRGTCVILRMPKTAKTG